MNTILFSVASLSLSMALNGAPMPDSVKAAGFNDADWEMLSRGQVANHIETETTASGATRAHSESGVVIRKPLKVCFDEVATYSNLSNYLPGLAESKVLERGENTFRAHAATKVFLMKFGYGLRFEVDRPRGEIRWKLDRTQPADIADTEGTWHFVALDDNTTLLHYSVHVDTGSALPQSIQNYFTKRSLPEMLVAFRDHMQTMSAGSGSDAH
jgi:ribosome-associated toxin RatA of RatAB toxin-antitoxin module